MRIVVIITNIDVLKVWILAYDRSNIVVIFSIYGKPRTVIRNVKVAERIDIRFSYACHYPLTDITDIN